MCVLSFMYKQAFPNEKPVTFHDWVANQFGERLFSIFFKTYTEKVWGMSCDEISADWAAQRIKGLDLWTRHVARAAQLAAAGQEGAGHQGNGEVIKTLIDSFQYPRKGPGMMWDAAARKVREQGGDIHMGTHAREPALGRAPARSGPSRARTEQGETQDLHGAATSSPRRRSASCWPASRPQPACKAAADKLRYRDFLTVALIVEKPDLFPDNWIYIHEPAVKVGRIQNFRSWSPEMVPDPEPVLPRPRVLLLRGRRAVERHRRRADRRSPRRSWSRSASPHGTTSRTAAWCARRRPIPSTTTATRPTSRRSAPSSPQKFPTLHLVGRNGMHKYNNQDHAMMTAMLTVRNIVAGSNIYDVWNVNEDAEYHEAGEAGAREALGSVRLVPQRVGAA